MKAYLLKKQYNDIENAADYDPQLWESQSQVCDTSWKANEKETKYTMDTNK